MSKLRLAYLDTVEKENHSLKERLVQIKKENHELQQKTADTVNLVDIMKEVCGADALWRPPAHLLA